MRLVALDLSDFRNLARAGMAPSPRATILIGENGQGKTNLLESIYLLCTLRPLRAARLAELVRFGSAEARVTGQFHGPGGVRTTRVDVTPSGRTAFLDDKPVGSSARLDEYFEGLAAVCFSPDDLLLVKGEPELRRRFLDRAAFNRWPAVLAEVREYLRALRTRNAALRAGSPLAVEESFRLPLARAGARLVRRRRDLVNELSGRVERAFAEISGAGAPPVYLAYRPGAGMAADGDEAALSAHLADILAQRLDRDRERGFTSAGPHVDDLVLALGEKTARTFASQGQQRALILALKIGEIENLRTALGRPPILLLDDVSSELDPSKNRFLLEYLSRLPGQAILTATDRRLLEPAAGPESVFYRVEQGSVTRLE